MNNKFWDSPAWTMGHRQESTFALIQAKKSQPKDQACQVQATITSQAMEQKLVASTSSSNNRIGNSNRTGFNSHNTPGPGK